MKNLLILLLVATMASCSNNNEMKSSSGNAANEQRMMEFYDQVMNAHNPDLIDSFITPDFVEHQPFQGYPPTMEGLKAGMKDWMAAYPDLNFKVHTIKSWGDTVMAHVTMSGTSSAPFMGMPATNKSFNVDGVDIVVLKDGKAREHGGYMEEMKMMHQLGMMGEDSTQAQ